MNRTEAYSLHLKKVSFAYNTTHQVLKDVSVIFEANERVAFIGPNGSGKSTFLQLLLRSLEPNSGKILLNDVDVTELDLKSYRNLFSVVSQEPYLFNDTIRYNLDPLDIATQSDVEKALRQSGADGFISKLPAGLDTEIGRNGAKLSGGEKQKLAVARALLRNTPIVILDEATSGFDVESDLYLHNVFLKEFAGKTVIMVTHRYSNLEGIDKVYRIVDGQLIPWELEER